MQLGLACADQKQQSTPTSATAEPTPPAAGTTAVPSAGTAGNKGSSSTSVSPQAGVPAAEAGTGGVGVSGNLGSAGVAGPTDKPQQRDDSDAGPSPDTSTEVTIVAEASFAPVSLMVTGAACAAGRCTIAAPSDGQLKVALSLEHSASGPMPVLARWLGCGTPTTTFFPVTPGSSDYILNYETQFSGLHAGSTCTAEIVEGGWLVFAGNMSLQVSEGDAFCTTLQVSQMGVNVSCFPPPGTRIVIEGDLPRWDCVQVENDGTVQDHSYMQTQLSLTSAANQLISCTGAAQ